MKLLILTTTVLFNLVLSKRLENALKVLNIETFKGKDRPQDIRRLTMAWTADNKIIESGDTFSYKLDYVYDTKFINHKFSLWNEFKEYATCDVEPGHKLKLFTNILCRVSDHYTPDEYPTVTITFHFDILFNAGGSGNNVDLEAAKKFKAGNNLIQWKDFEQEVYMKPGPFFGYEYFTPHEGVIYARPAGPTYLFVFIAPECKMGIEHAYLRFSMTKSPVLSSFSGKVTSKLNDFFLPENSYDHPTIIKYGRNYLVASFDNVPVNNRFFLQGYIESPEDGKKNEVRSIYSVKCVGENVKRRKYVSNFVILNGQFLSEGDGDKNFSFLKAEILNTDVPGLSSVKISGGSETSVSGLSSVKISGGSETIVSGLSSANMSGKLETKSSVLSNVNVSGGSDKIKSGLSGTNTANSSSTDIIISSVDDNTKLLDNDLNHTYDSHIETETEATTFVSCFTSDETTTIPYTLSTDDVISDFHSSNDEFHTIHSNDNYSSLTMENSHTDTESEIKTDIVTSSIVIDSASYTHSFESDVVLTDSTYSTDHMTLTTIIEPESRQMSRQADQSQINLNPKNKEIETKKTKKLTSESYKVENGKGKPKENKNLRPKILTQSIDPSDNIFHDFTDYTGSSSKLHHFNYLSIILFFFFFF